MRMLNRTKSSKLNKIQQITSSISDSSIRYILVGETNESYPILYTGKINFFLFKFKFIVTKYNERENIPQQYDLLINNDEIKKNYY